MKRLLHALVGAAAIVSICFSAASSAQDIIYAQDLRLLAVAESLQTANAMLCERQAPALGAALQSKDQFAVGTDPGFAADVAFGVILPGSTAAMAEIVEGDGLIAIGAIAVERRAGLEKMPLRDSAHAILAEHPLAAPLKLTVVRAGAQREVVINAPVQCRALVELLVDGATIARSDGRIIQLSLGLAQRASDGELAVIFAHELAHAVLHHRDRLAREGVSKGFGGEFGRDLQLNAEAEIEADRLSVHLLANAGYDPRIAPAFWRGELGRKTGGGLLRSRVYSSPEQRAAMMEKEISDYLAGGAPSWPGHLLAKR